MPNVNINAPVGSKALSNGFGTVTGNKSFGTQNCVIDEVVFLQSTQCIPLIRFPSSLVPNQSKGEIPGVLPPWVEKMQKVVDDFFNNDSYPTSLNIEAISQQQPENAAVTNTCTAGPVPGIATQPKRWLIARRKTWY